VVAEGPADACEQLLMLLEGGETPGRVVRLTYRWDEPQGISGFSER
jgi:acylphosphatase